MADHLDAPGLTSPGDDARLDITDIYAFQKPGDSDKSILMLNVNPLAPTLADSFNEDALYVLNIDTDGDVVPNRAFLFRFSEFEDGQQTVTVRLVVHGEGDEHRHGRRIIKDAPVSFGPTPEVTRRGPFALFAGIRSDPFFFDLAGFLAGLKFTGDDFFKDKNVFGIALEVPNSALGQDPNIGLWGRTFAANGVDGDDEAFRVDHRDHRKLVRVDRMGRPAINTVFNKGDDKNVFNDIDPDQDRSLFAAKFVDVLTHAPFGRSQADAEAIVAILLPDLLTYDYSKSAGYLNGRNLTDHVIAISLDLLTGGKLKTDGTKPHTDLLRDFPYMGNPH